MTTDTAVLERALVVMAIAMSVQTLLFIGAAVAAFIAWRRGLKPLETLLGLSRGDLALVFSLAALGFGDPLVLSAETF